MRPLLRQRRWYFLVLLLPPLCVVAIEQLQLRLPGLQGRGLAISGLTTQVDLLPSGRLAGRLELERLEHVPSGERLQGLRLQCDDLALDAARLRCGIGRFALADWRGQSLQGPFTLDYAQDRDSLTLNLGPAAYAGGRVRVELHYTAGRWRARVEGEGLAAQTVAALAAPWLPDGYRFGAGRLDLQAEAAGAAGLLQRLALELQLGKLAFSNASGLAAGEALAGELSLSARHTGNDYEGSFAIALDQGGLYLDPVYADFAAQPLQASGQYHLAPDAGRVRLSGVELAQPDLLAATLEVELDREADALLQQARVDIQRLDLAGFFPTYAAPWLAGTAFSDLAARGRVSGSLSLRADRLETVDVVLEAVALEDPAQRLSLEGLAGNLAWGRDDRPRTLRIGWERGSLYRLELGAAGFRLQSRGNQYRLLEPAEVEVLDGRLLIEEWELSDPGSGAMRWHIDAILTPVSMQRVTSALEWPPMQGQLSGVIPEVRYAEGRVEVGGMLLVRVFDGAVRVRELRLDQPLGLVPQLQADIEIDNIDLEQLTGTFAFGRIEGRLDGHVRELWLQNWEPLAFDAVLVTPEDDTSRHRISQRAVDNLSRIGGGVGQALSQTFLGLFEEFPYDRLGIRCRLRNGVCEMGGVAPAEQGYYLVRGTWLPPRINVIGYADTVDWPALVGRLKAATAGGAPQIQ
ncbi:MAG: hypothetical protein CMN57_08715 [Gammaproteobacteria bacterium]|nr:hypothetical protein [Gammaproteobacteria bacterium]